MSLRERLDQLRNQTPPPGETPPSQDNLLPKEPAESTRILEALGFDKILHQIREEVWQSGTITPIEEHRDKYYPEIVISSISLYDYWPKLVYPSGKPSLSVAVGQIPANRFDQKPIFLAKIVAVNEPEKEPERWPKPESKFADIFLLTESTIGRAKERIEELLLKDCFDRESRMEVPYTQKRKIDFEAVIDRNSSEIPNFLKQATPEMLEARLRAGEPFLPYPPDLPDDAHDWKEIMKTAFDVWRSSREIRMQHFILERSKRPNVQEDEVEVPSGESLVIEGAMFTVLNTYIGERGARIDIRIRNLSRPTLEYNSVDFDFLTPDGRIRSGYYERYQKNLEKGILLKGGIVEGPLHFEAWESERENLWSDLYLVFKDTNLSDKTYLFELA